MQKSYAWLMSLAVHLTIMLLLALAVRVPTRGAGLKEEPGRQASLVLSRQRGDQREYFHPDDSQKSAATEADHTLPLPETAASSLEPLVEVAQAPDGAAAATEALSELLAGPSLSGRGRLHLPSGDDISSLVAEEMQRRGGYSGPQGPVASMSLFGGSPSQGRRFAFVVDRSRSMGSAGLGGLRAVEEALQQCLQVLEPEHRFAILAYNHTTVSYGGKTLVPATQENLEGVKGFFARVAAYGATNHGQAIFAALRQRPDVIYLFTDGGDPFLTPAQMQEITALAQNQGVSIHCVQFGLGANQQADGFLERLARMNHGGYQYVDMAKRRG